MNNPKTNALFVRTAPAIFVFLWSTGYVGARYGLPYIEPLTMTAIRFAIVVALLGVMVAASRAPLPREPRMIAHLAVSGCLIHTCFIGGIFSAIKLGTEIGIAALIAGAQPLLTAIIAVTLLGEVLHKRQWLGFVLGFAGLAMVVTRSFALGALPPAGLAGCVLAVCGMTFGTVYQKRFVTGVDLRAGSLLQFSFALLPCIAWSFLFETRSIAWELPLVLALAWLVLALSLGAISVLLYLIREGAAARVSSLFYLVPPVTALQGVLLFGETLGPIQIAGILVTALGVWLINTEVKAVVRT